jgi:hypothetical protein
MRRLIINADELGLCESTNEAIEACHRFGTVSSTSVIVNMWDFAGAARVARDNPRLGIGAHLNLTDGKPVAPPAEVPTLVGSEGRFHRRPELFRRLIAGRISMGDVRREWTAQLQRLDDTGFELTHLDSHEHVHGVPALSRVLFDLAGRRGLAARCLSETFVSPTGRRPGWGMLRPIYLKRWLRSWLFGAFSRRSDVPRPRTLLSFHGVSGTRDRLPELNDYVSLLRSLPADDVSEMMVHPGRADETLVSFCTDGRAGAKRREAEFGLLTSAVFKRVLSQADVLLETFAAVR